METTYYNSYGFSERTTNDYQISVQNVTGRTVLMEELVYLGGYFGEVKNIGGIADSAYGQINTFPFRTIQTNQIETTDTFVAGQVIYFAPGDSTGAGKLRAANSTGRIPVGVCVEFEGTSGAHTAIVFRPFVQNSSQYQGAGLKTLAVPVPTGSDTAPVVSTNFPVGATILDIIVHTIDTSASGTVTVSDGTNDITDAIAMDTANAVTRASSIDQTYNVVTSDGLTFTAAGATDAGIVYVIYI